MNVIFSESTIISCKSLRIFIFSFLLGIFLVTVIASCSSNQQKLLHCISSTEQGTEFLIQIPISSSKQVKKEL